MVHGNKKKENTVSRVVEKLKRDRKVKKKNPIESSLPIL